MSISAAISLQHPPMPPIKMKCLSKNLSIKSIVITCYESWVGGMRRCCRLVATRSLIVANRLSLVVLPVEFFAAK